MKMFSELADRNSRQYKESFSENSNWNLWYDFVPDKDLSEIYKHNFNYGITSPILYR